jgi:ABC-type transporter Mla subunit MlaD
MTRRVSVITGVVILVVAVYLVWAATLGSIRPGGGTVPANPSAALQAGSE